MHAIVFTPRGKRELKKLPGNIQQRILKKLQENAKLADPLLRARPLVNLPPATHRFRIGNYRASFYFQNGIIFIERIESRGQAYR